MYNLKSITKELTNEQKENYLFTTNSFFEIRKKINPDAIVGVAEGDSWFDYPPSWFEDPIHGDLIGHLNRSYDYNILRVSEAGDTLENMVYGTDYNDANWTPKPCQIEETRKLIKKRDPQFFLFSGGGNDIAGAELESYLNHKDSGMPILRENYIEYVFGEVFKKTFNYLISQIMDVSPDIHIFFHGYGYPIPDGRGVFQITPGWQFVGPWLRPALTKKRIDNMEEMREIMNYLINKFNDFISTLESISDRIHYIDLRPVISDSDWVNELHLSSSGYGKVAKAFDDKIRSVMNQ